MENKYFLPQLLLGCLIALFPLSMEARHISKNNTQAGIIKVCQSEIKLYCSHTYTQNRTIRCLRDNEKNLISKNCISEVQTLIRTSHNGLLPSEFPFRSSDNSMSVQ